jgi:hypothetical protein
MEHCFLVSKFVLAEVPWFNNFFSKQQELSTYYLPDNNSPSTLHTLFLILHHRMHCLPVFLYMHELVQLAAVCQEFNVSHIVMPHVVAREWVDHHWEDKKPSGMDWVAWVKILRGLYSTEEHCPKLVIVLDVIAANMYYEGGRWIFKSDKISHHVADIDLWEPALRDPECKHNLQNPYLFRRN